KIAPAAECGVPLQFLNRSSYQVVVVATGAQIGSQQVGFDIGITFAVLPIAKVRVVEDISNQVHDVVLREPLDLPHAHGCSSEDSADSIPWFCQPPRERTPPLVFHASRPLAARPATTAAAAEGEAKT